MSGRVADLLQHARPFSLMAPSSSMARGGPGGGIPSTPVSDLYFSDLNVRALQHGIRYGVWKRTGEVIDEQSPTELQVIMRSVFLQNAHNRPANVVEQVRQLNGLVLDYAVPSIVGEMQMRSTYLADISQLPTPLPHSINTSVRGTRTLELNDF